MERKYNPNDIERHFSHENVWVRVPDQGRPGLRIVQSELPERWDLPGDHKDFELSRRVINFEVQDEDGTSVEVFAPAMELRVGLTPSEMRRWLQGESVKLAYAVSGTQEWVVFTQEKHNLRIEPDARDAVVEISDWADPTVGLGR
jgi:hypothetical protein